MDIQQINKLLGTLINSDKLIAEIQSDIDKNHSTYSDTEILKKLFKNIAEKIKQAFL